MTTFINEAWSDFFSSIGFGEIEGHRRVTALGNNPDVDTGSVPEDVWTGGGLYPWMTGATMLEAVSDSVNDTAAGTGARSISISSLDTAFAEVPLPVTLNGVTPVPFASSAYRINFGSVTAAGSVGTNVGKITIRDAGGGTTRAIIPAGYGVTRQSVYTVPAGYTLTILSQLFSINRSGGVSRYATAANFIRGVSGVYRLPLEVSFSERQPYRHDGNPGITLAEKTDYSHRVMSVSNDNTDISTGLLGFLRAATVD